MRIEQSTPRITMFGRDSTLMMKSLLGDVKVMQMCLRLMTNSGTWASVALLYASLTSDNGNISTYRQGNDKEIGNALVYKYMRKV